MAKSDKLSTEQHIPLRTCIATGEKFPKRDLIRIVSQNGGPLEYDLTGKKSGRGANLSMTKEALELAIQKRAFDRAFKRKITPEEIEYLKANFDEVIEEKKFRNFPSQKVNLRVKKDDLENIE